LARERWDGFPLLNGDIWFYFNLLVLFALARRDGVEAGLFLRGIAELDCCETVGLEGV
jgi:hypothetical protein